MFFKSTPAVCQTAVRLCPDTGVPIHTGDNVVHPHHRMMLGATRAIANRFGDGDGADGVPATIGRCVVVGCGGGSLPMALRSHAELVDVMEISAEVLDSARKHFGLREGPGLRTLLGDALETLRPASAVTAQSQHSHSTTAGFYDLVIVDVDAG